jgi:hypothetical protein
MNITFVEYIYVLMLQLMVVKIFIMEHFLPIKLPMQIMFILVQMMHVRSYPRKSYSCHHDWVNRYGISQMTTDMFHLW